MIKQCVIWLSERDVTGSNRHLCALSSTVMPAPSPDGSLQQRFPGIVESNTHAHWRMHTWQVCASLWEVRRGGESAPAPTIKHFDFFVSRRRSKMFMSVWYAKKIGSRFLDNVRKTKKHRHRKMVGTIQACFLLYIYIFFTIILPLHCFWLILLWFSEASKFWLWSQCCSWDT